MSAALNGPLTPETRQLRKFALLVGVENASLYAIISITHFPGWPSCLFQTQFEAQSDEEVFKRWGMNRAYKMTIIHDDALALKL